MRLHPPHAKHNLHSCSGVTHYEVMKINSLSGVSLAIWSCDSYLQDQPCPQKAAQALSAIQPLQVRHPLLLHAIELRGKVPCHKACRACACRGYSSTIMRRGHRNVEQAVQSTDIAVPCMYFPQLRTLDVRNVLPRQASMCTPVCTYHPKAHVPCVR